MTFLQPIILFGLPLALLPVVIHLLNRLRHRTQQWAAMRFLVAASRSSVNKAKLKQFLILLFRTLAVLMLLFFLARPLTGGWMGWAFASAPDTVLILLDRSLSMETRLAGTSLSRRERSLELLEQAAEPYKGHSHFVLLESASGKAQTIKDMRGLSDHAMTAPTDTAANIPSLLQRAFQWLIDNQAGTTEIWIASDLQRSNWQPSDDRWASLMLQFRDLPQTLRFRLLTVNEQTELDTAIELADLQLGSTEEGRTMRVVTDIVQSDISQESLMATRLLNGLAAGVEIPVQAAEMRWQGQWTLGTQEDAGWGSLTLPADANIRNNSFFFVYGKERPHQSLTLAGKDYIGRVLALASGVIDRGILKASKHIQPSSQNNLPSKDVSMVVWQGELPEGTRSEELMRFTSEGGVVVFFPSQSTTTDETTFAGVRWMDIEQAQGSQSYEIGRWEKETGPLADTDEGFSLPLEQLEIRKRRRIQHADTVLAAFSDGEPLLLHQKVGQGGLYFMTTLPANDWSGLDQGTVLLPMLQRMGIEGRRRLESTLFWNCGEVSSLELESGWQPVDEEASDLKIDWHAGIYRLGERLAAVNPPPSELEMTSAEREEITQLFADQNFQMFLEVASEKQTHLQGEIWRVFLFLMLLFLLVESWLMMSGPGTMARLAVQPPRTQPSTGAVES
jgi:hypothetical protein